jgi:hypothetical protein
VTTSPSPSTEPKPSLADVRLAGTYEVKLFVTSNSYSTEPSKKQQFKLKPKCKSGACDTYMTGTIRFGAHSTQIRHQSGTTSRFAVRLSHLGKGYAGRVVDFFGSCGSSPGKEPWTFSLKPTGERNVNGNWVVSAWAGTWTRSTPAGGGCSASHLRAVIRGSLK